MSGRTRGGADRCGGGGDGAAGRLPPPTSSSSLTSHDRLELYPPLRGNSVAGGGGAAGGFAGAQGCRRRWKCEHAGAALPQLPTEDHRCVAGARERRRRERCEHEGAEPALQVVDGSFWQGSREDT